MAHTTVNSPAASGGIGAIFTSVFDWMIRVAENNSGVREAQALYALSDQELAARGLTRDEIAMHVFKYRV